MEAALRDLILAGGLINSDNIADKIKQSAMENNPVRDVFIRPPDLNFYDRLIDIQLMEEGIYA